MKQKLLIPKHDIVFQTLFSKLNEDITKAFISDILQIKIEKINLNVDKNLVKKYAEEKLGVLDLRAELNDGMQCNIEIQLTQYENIIERFLSYWARIYTEKIKRGDKYTELKRTISVLIIDDKIDKLKDIIHSHTKWQIREEENKEIILTKDLEIHIIELPKALKEYKEKPKNVVMQWMKFLDNPNDMEVQKIMEENKNIKKAGEKLEEISSDETLRRLEELREKGRIEEYERNRYMKRKAQEEGREQGLKKGREQGLKEGREKGIKEGRKEGRKEAIEEIVEKMKKVGMTDEQIQEILKDKEENE